MKRRTFVKGLLAPAVSAISGFQMPFANAADYDGKLFVFVQADGGWDPTSFCDPKTNTPGEKIINHWAENRREPASGQSLLRGFRQQRSRFLISTTTGCWSSTASMRTDEFPLGRDCPQLERPGVGRVSQHDRIARGSSWPGSYRLPTSVSEGSPIRPVSLPSLA